MYVLPLMPATQGSLGGRSPSSHPSVVDTYWLAAYFYTHNIPTTAGERRAAQPAVAACLQCQSPHTWGAVGTYLHVSSMLCASSKIRMAPLTSIEMASRICADAGFRV